MNNGGYILFDCGGLDLNNSSKQTITGIYARAKKALSMNKPVYACDCVMSGAPCTPVSVVAWAEGADVIATGHVLRITIDKDDGVTVVPA